MIDSALSFQRPARTSSISARTRALLMGRLAGRFLSKSVAICGVMSITCAVISASGASGGGTAAPFADGTGDTRTVAMAASYNQGKSALEALEPLGHLTKCVLYYPPVPGDEVNSSPSMEAL